MGHHGFPRKLLPAAGSESGEKKLLGLIQSHWEVLVGWTHGPGAGGPPWMAQPNRGRLGMSVHTLPAGRSGPSSPALAPGATSSLCLLPPGSSIIYLIFLSQSMSSQSKFISIEMLNPDHQWKPASLAIKRKQPLQRNAVETAWPLGSGWMLVPGWVRLLEREGSHLLLWSP